jgi:hypothetical protein
MLPGRETWENGGIVKPVYICNISGAIVREELCSRLQFASDGFAINRHLNDQ